MLNQFHSWNKSHMVMVYNSFYVLMVLFGNILLCPCSLEILVYSFFFFLWCLRLILVSGYYWLHRMIWEVDSHLLFIRRACENLVPLLFNALMLFNASLKCLLEFSRDDFSLCAVVFFLLWIQSHHLLQAYSGCFLKSVLVVCIQVPLSMDSPGKNTGVGCHFLLQGILLEKLWNSVRRPNVVTSNCSVKVFL